MRLGNSVLPAAAGIGLKPQHYGDLLEATPINRPAWVEVHPQNYFADGGPRHHWLEQVVQAFPLSFHSTGLSLGSAQGLSDYDLAALAILVERYQPAIVSDHLSWSHVDDHCFPDLLPMPYTQEALAHFGDSVSRVQDRLQRAILIENPSRYLAFADDEMDEATFLSGLCQRAGCGILLDLNNIEVSAGNLGLDAQTMADAIDGALVGEIHVAGHAVEQHGDFTLRIDDHGSPVSAICWALLSRFIARAGPKPVLVEWDTNVPGFAALCAEVNKADACLAASEKYHVAAG
jgi:uncharacterized protein